MRKLLLLIPILLLMTTACETDQTHVDVSEVTMPELQVFRFEQDLFSVNAANLESNTLSINKKYGEVYDHFLMNALKVMGTSDTAYRREVLRFTNDRDVRGAYNDTRVVFKNIDDITSGVQLMAKRFHTLFPSRALPKRFITVISGWNYAVAYMDSSLFLSLDMYLGDTSRFYQMLRFPQYQVRKMNRLHILPDLARGWVLTEMDTIKPENTLLNHTIFYGKLFYAVQALVPDAADSVVIGYTSEQIKTCNTYQKQYWGYMAEKNRLYENSLVNIRELTSDGPFTSAISKECPPRIAMWIGWQIVRSYMKKNPEVSIEDLMNERDAQKILSRSKYRP